MTLMARYAVIAMAVLAVACDNARRGTDGAMGTIGANSANTDWVEDSMEAGSFEVELGKLAQQKASSPEVRQFAEMMVRDHTKAGEELKQVAQQHSIVPEPEADDAHRDLIEELSQKSGAEFDHAYMEAMVDSHQNVVDHLRSRADAGDRTLGTSGNQEEAAEEALSAWATKTLPTARHHLDEARRIEDSLDDSAANTAPTSR
jgi:putative membrane protein